VWTRGGRGGRGGSEGGEGSSIGQSSPLRTLVLRLMLMIHSPWLHGIHTFFIDELRNRNLLGVLIRILMTMPSKPATSIAPGNEVEVIPQNLMNIDRVKRSLEEDINTAKEPQIRQRIGARQLGGEGLGAAAGHAAATTLSTPPPPQQQPQQPMLLQLPQPPPCPRDILLMIRSDTESAATATGSALLHNLGMFVGDVCNLLDNSQGDGRLDPLRIIASTLAGRMQGKFFHPPPPPSPADTCSATTASHAAHAAWATVICSPSAAAASAALGSLFGSGLLIITASSSSSGLAPPCWRWEGRFTAP
jgi:hypothetical protein